jgi:hypothetical protein
MSDPSERAGRGAATFQQVVGRPLHPPGSPFTEDEMREFVLQFGVFQGFPKAAEVEVMLGQILRERAAK